MTEDRTEAGRGMQTATCVGPFPAAAMSHQTRQLEEKKGVYLAFGSRGMRPWWQGGMVASTSAGIGS